MEPEAVKRKPILKPIKRRGVEPPKKKAPRELPEFPDLNPEGLPALTTEDIQSLQAQRAKFKGGAFGKTGGGDHRSAKWHKRIRVIRQQAQTDYVADPEMRSVLWHYARSDRPYNTIVNSDTFVVWSVDDKWSDKRDAFWKDITEKVIAKWRDKLLEQRFKEIERLTDATNLLSEYMYPLKNPDGTIKRDAETGLPLYPLDMPKMDKFVKMLLEMDSKLMVKRGEATQRTETMTLSADGQKVAHLDPVSSTVHALSQDDVQAMARVLLMRKQPELLEAAAEIIDSTAEEEPKPEPAKKPVKKDGKA